MSQIEKPFWAADNEAMRPFYGKPLKIIVAHVKDKAPYTSFLVMRDVNEHPSPTQIHLNAVYDADPANRPTTHAAHLERAGATFFEQCELMISVASPSALARLISVAGHQSEQLRYIRSPTMITNIAFKKLERTDENLRLAQEELNSNTLGLEEGQIIEERKTLQWLKDGAHIEQHVANN